MKREPALTAVSDAYTTYGKYVNGGRAIPSLNDGLKDVQRRLLVAAKESGARSGLVHSPAIVGTCVAKYNPHSEGSSYDTLVRMVNQPVPLIYGKGNFGYQGVVREPAAAMRYTSAGMTDLADMFLDSMAYVPYHKNELGTLEPDYLPTPIPYALLNGASGIGVGIACHIPRVTKDSLRVVCRDILLKDKENEQISYWLRPAPLGRGQIEIDNDELYKLNFVGEGRATCSADVQWEYSKVEGRQVIVVTNAPHRVPYTRLFAKIKDYIEEGLVSVRDESGETDRLVVIRHARVRRVTDDDLFDIVQKAMTRKVYFKVVAHQDGYAQQVGLYDWLRHTLELSVQAHQASLEAQRKKLDLELVFIRVKAQLASLLLKDESKSVIMKECKLDDEQYSYCTSKSINQLSRKNNQEDKVVKAVETINRRLENVRSDYWTVIKGYLK